MRPVSDPSALEPGATLYHSAFGFARVRVAEPDAVLLDWNRPGPHLPVRVRHDNLRRVYALCAPEGFFHRALDERDALQRTLHERPVDALVWLLQDLAGPQRLRDVMDWLVGRELFTPKTFVRWWATAESAVRSDPRLSLDGEWLHQASEAPRPPGHTPGAQLDPEGLDQDEDQQLSRLIDDDDDDTDTSEVVSLDAPISHEVYLPLDAVPLTDARPPAAAWTTIGLAFAEAIHDHHARGESLHPTSDTAQLHPDGSIHLLPSNGRTPAPAEEVVYLAAIALIEAFIGRHTPPGVEPHRLLPHLRHQLPGLPPTALGPLASALHPHAHNRPSPAQWREQWNRASHQERLRAEAYRKQAILRVGYDSHIGRVKVMLTQTNQDALFVGARQHETLAVLADGISLSDAGSGDQASRLAVSTVAKVWSRVAPGRVPSSRLLDRALVMGNDRICQASLVAAEGDVSGRMPMGTTVIVAHAQGNRIHLASLGDSRAYVVGPAGAGLLTADDNVSGEGFRRWCNQQARAWHPDGHALVRYLGHFNAEGEPAPLQPHHTTLVLAPEERLVLLTDGVSDYIADDEPTLVGILADVARRGTPEQASRALIAMANDGGGGDNATVIVLASPADAV